jgi:hypothetical protein
MSKFQSITTKNFFQGFVSIGPAEAREGLPRLKNAIAKDFSSSSVTYSDGNVYVQLRNVDALGDNTLSERIMDAFIAAFPHLATESPTLCDDILGKLTWDDECDGFEGQAALGGNEVDVLLLTPPEPAPLSVIRRAGDVVFRWPEWWRMIRPSIIGECLSLYNDEWRSFDETGSGLVLTEDDFLNRLLPTTLHVGPDLKFKVYFDADGMFTEHGITVEVSAEDQVVAYME